MEDPGLDALIKSSQDHVYLIREREFILMQKPIYKIGKTTQTPNLRVSQYPKHSEILILADVPNCHEAEKMVIKQFTTFFTPEPEYGSEYFSGDVQKMKVVMYNICGTLALFAPENKLITDNDIDTPHDNNLEEVTSDTIEETVITKTITKKRFGARSLKAFCKHLYDTRPLWYVEGEYVDLEVIDNAYREYFGGDETRSQIAKKLNGILYDESDRINGVTKKRLVMFDRLI